VVCIGSASRPTRRTRRSLTQELTAERERTSRSVSFKRPCVSAFVACFCAGPMPGVRTRSETIA
jgi:hypothetical protein